MTWWLWLVLGLLAAVVLAVSVTVPVVVTKGKRRQPPQRTEVDRTEKDPGVTPGLYYMDLCRTEDPLRGRLCNRFFYNVYWHRMAEKYDLKVRYMDVDVWQTLGFPPFHEGHIVEHEGPAFIITDANMMQPLTEDLHHHDFQFPSEQYLQTKPFTHVLRTYVEAHLKCSPPQSGSVFLHIRLGDIAHHSPGAAYYINVLRTLGDGVTHGAITSDSPEHAVVKAIQRAFPFLSLFEGDEVTTLLEAQRHEHVVLSYGTFSFVMGLLAQRSTIHVPKHPRWHPNFYDFPDWVGYS